MAKRLEITVRNPGFEGTDHALGALVLDFEDDEVLNSAKDLIYSYLSVSKNNIRTTIVVQNEKKQLLGFNPEYYVSHRIADTDDWALPSWMLPHDGDSAPDREGT